MLDFDGFKNALKNAVDEAARNYTDQRSYPVHITVDPEDGEVDYYTFQALQGSGMATLSRVDTAEEMKNWSNYLDAELVSAATELYEEYKELCD